MAVTSTLIHTTVNKQIHNYTCHHILIKLFRPWRYVTFFLSQSHSFLEKGQRNKKKKITNYSNQFSRPLKKDDDRNVNPTGNQPICAQCFVSLLCQRAPHLQVGLLPPPPPPLCELTHINQLHRTAIT